MNPFGISDMIFIRQDRFILKVLQALVVALAMLLPTTLQGQSGDVTAVHDPSIIQSGDLFYLFSTGRGISERSSTDLLHWKRIGKVLQSNPPWTRQYVEKPNAAPWAPDISFVDGEYRLYYAVSKFGTTASAIGLLVNSTLDSSSPHYHWIDRGKIISTSLNEHWNAIDPCAFLDGDGKAWMVLGSCWTGLKIVRLDRATGLVSAGDGGVQAIAAYPPNNIIEEGYVRRHGGYYYLWESVDHCCRGVDSTYRILVGRSKQPVGPYLDRDGRPMLEGGGTLVLSSYDNVRGPGSCAIVDAFKAEYLIHHEYDGGNWGVPTLQVRQLFWDKEGWPSAGEPIESSLIDKPVDNPVFGTWTLRVDFQDGRPITLKPDHSLSPYAGSWAIDGNILKLTFNKPAKTWIEDYQLSSDRSFFVGRNDSGQCVTGLRRN
jgi:arabinan endo-1,5-alpha-L-arabinosidase